MSEKPIIFSGPMVRALRERRKTQTRRIVKVCCERAAHPLIGTWGVDFTACECGAVKLPYAPGDVLWVRETWGMTYVDVAERDKRPFVEGGTWGSTALPHRKPCVVFRADGDDMPDDSPHETARWSPSIHMPRAFARTFLTVTGVRIERVQDISEADAIAEGSFLGRCPCPTMQRKPQDSIDACFRQTACHIHGDEFSSLWNSINGPGAWERNDWVWVYDLEGSKP